MKILLTNDDGYKALGINTLKKVLEKDFDIYMIAPLEERSACSNAITIKDNMGMNKIDDRTYAITGYPADCVTIALSTDFLPEPDLVISGINHGPNLADDVYYSGTVGAARSAYIHGKNAIAVSLDSHDMWFKSPDQYEEHFQDAAEFISRAIKNKILYNEKEITLTNINYPVKEDRQVLGSKCTFLGKRRYLDYYEVTSPGKDYDKILKLRGTVESRQIEGSDTAEVEKGYISITPLTLDSTDYKRLAILEKALKK